MATPFKRSSLPISFDSRLEIAKGNVAGHSVIHKFGSALDVDTSPEDVWSPGGLYTGFLTAATIVELTAGATDTGGAAGARKVMVQGLDANFNFQEEEITLTGATAADSTKLFIRVFRMFVTETGTYGGANVGIVNCNVDGAGALLARITAGTGQTEMAIYTIPAGRRAYIMGLHYLVASAQTASVALWQRTNADDVVTPFTGSKRLIFQTLGLAAGRDEVEFFSPIEIGAKTDIWMSATGGASGTDVIAEFDLVIVEE